MVELVEKYTFLQDDPTSRYQIEAFRNTHKCHNTSRVSSLTVNQNNNFDKYVAVEMATCSSTF